MLRKIIEDTYKRHTGAVLAPAVAVDSAAKVETPVKEQVKWIFSEWDLNDDGLVTGAEFKESLATLCDQMSPEDVETVVQIVDKNKDGQVDVDEFLEWVFSGAEHAEKVLAETAAPAPPEPSTAKDGDAEAEVTEVAEAETLHEPAAASPEQPPAAPSTEPEQAEASAETAAEAPAEPSSAEPAPAPPTEVGAETEDAADLPAAPFSTASCRGCTTLSVVNLNGKPDQSCWSTADVVLNGPAGSRASTVLGATGDEVGALLKCPLCFPSLGSETELVI